MTKDIGLVQVYTGEGKGKTTAALGLALRALGWNKKVAIVQFVKGNKKIGEINITRKNIPELSFHQLSNDSKFILKTSSNDRKIAEKTLNFAIKLINSQKYDMVILDEINIALSLKLIEIKKVLELIKNKPKFTELVLTGRNAPKEIIKIADLVTEMKMIKHPYNKKIKARKGIEY